MRLERDRALTRSSHHANITPIFFVLNDKPWIPMAMKIRMVEYKIRLNLLTYASVGCPPLDFNGVTEYKPRDESLVAKPTGTCTLSLSPLTFSSPPVCPSRNGRCDSVTKVQE